MYYNIKDSSVYYHPKDQKLNHRNDGSICVGIVRGTGVEDDGTIYYKVELFKEGSNSMVACQPVSRFGSPHNYEEYSLRPYHKNNDTIPESEAATLSYRFKAGECVIVAGLNGDWREAVILGCLSHPSRASNLEPGVSRYQSVFNGLETTIGDDGAYKVKWNGKPINDSLLDVPPEVSIGTPPPEPQYNLTSTGTFYGIDTNGSFTVSDDNGQLIKIKKSTGNISIVSGTNRIEIGASDISGMSDSITLKSGNLIAGAQTIDMNALDTVKVSAISSVSIKALNIAIGNDVIELFDGLLQLIDTIGTITVTSPVGPCTPIKATPQWVKVEILKQQLGTLKGSVEDAENVNTAFVLDQDNFTV